MITWMLGWMLDGSWIDFYSILGPFWEASWHQVGTKIKKMKGPRGHQKVYTKQGPRRAAGGTHPGGGAGPLVLRTRHPEGPGRQALDSLQALAPQGRVADIFVE